MFGRKKIKIKSIKQLKGQGFLAFRKLKKAFLVKRKKLVKIGKRILRNNLKAYSGKLLNKKKSYRIRQAYSPKKIIISKRRRSIFLADVCYVLKNALAIKNRRWIPRVSTQRKWLKPIFASILIIILVSGLFYGNNQSLGYTYTFTQNSWIGGSSVNPASHLTDQINWDEYASSSNLIVGANIALPNNNDSIAHTLDADFGIGSEDTTDNTAVTGDSVQLAPLPSTGDGSDGVLSVSGTFNINTQTNGNGGRACADGISYNVISLTANTATLSGTPPVGCFATGDQVMLINMQGDGIDYGNAGNYEILEIQSILGDQITFTENKTKYYGDGMDSDDSNLSTNTYSEDGATLGTGIADVGTNSAPAFGDLNGDGIYDAVIGLSTGTLVWYRNDGTASDPSWTDATASWGTGVASVASNAAPALVDLSGDGLRDLVIGNNAGVLAWYQNIGSSSAPAWTSATASWGIGVADVGAIANPNFVDLNGDGLRDLVIGNQTGYLNYWYRNTGTSSVPAWTSDVASLGPGFFNFDFGTNAAPAFSDLDNDGKYDLVVGEVDGVLNWYRNTGTALAPGWTESSVTLATGVSALDVGSNSTPAFIDLDNDGYGDLVAGEADGVLNWYSTSLLPAGITQKVILQRIPQYSTVSIANGGSLTASDWDGSKGGVLSFLASGTVTVDNGGSITMSDKGFRGSVTSNRQGESYNKLGASSTSANLGGGGAYYIWDAFCGEENSLGGGGGYGVAGETILSAQGGSLYGSDDLQKIYLGSAGGTGSGGSSGGDGGGIIHISAGSINSTGGNITNNGSSVTSHVNANGGGSGGSIYLLGSSVVLGDTSHVSTSGGNGDDIELFCGGNASGGDGGAGRIHVKSNSITGTTSPTYVSSSLATNYYDSGTFVSGVLDTGQKTSTWGNLTWNATLNGETVSVKARTCDDASCSGEDVSKDWNSVCTNITSGNALFTGGCATDGDRYVQYQSTLSTTDSLVTPSLDDVTIGYSYYSTSGSLISSAYDTTDAMNVMNKIVWDEGSLPNGTDVKFQIQTSLDNVTWTGWEGPDGTDATYFTNEAGGESMPANFMAGNNDKWFKYQVFLTSDGNATPTLSEVQVFYVVNASPEFQNVSAIQNTGIGTVTVSYEVRDTDTEIDQVNIALQYCIPGNCDDIDPQNWQWTDAMTISGDTGTVGVTTVYQAKSLIWTPKADFSGQYNATQKIRIVADDSQPANNLGYGSTILALDTKNPIAPQITFDRSKSADQITIVATEDSTSGMQYALNFPNAAVDGSSDPCDFASPDWQNFTFPSQTVTIADNNDEVRKVCVLFRDEYGNVSSNLNNFALTPRTPYSFQYYDVSNVDIGDYRLFLSWGVPADMAEGKEGGSYGFSQYDIQRCSDLKDNPDCVPSITYETVVSKLENSLTDSESGLGLDPNLRYCYRYRVKDSNPDPSGDFSKWSDTICAVPGSGTSSITKNVSIHWYPTAEENVPPDQVYTTQATILWQTVNAADPNEAILSDSTVWWRVQGSSEWTESYSISSYVEDHAITIPGRLAPGTTYEYRVTSTSPWGASDTLDGTLPATFTTKLGPVIRNVQTVSVGNTNAAIEWDTEDQFGNPVNASSVLYYSVALDANGNLVAPQTANCSGGYSTHHACTIADLTSGYHYYYYVYSILESDTDAFAADTNGGDFYRFTTTTDTTPPLITPDGGNPLILTDTQTALAFDTNERSESWLLFDTISYSEASFPSDNFDPDNASHNPYADYISSASSNLAHTFVFSLDALIPETTYYYRFVSEDVSGNASAGTEYSFTTLRTQVDQHDPLADISTPVLDSDPGNSDIIVGDSFVFVSWETDQPANQTLECSETQGGSYGLTTAELISYNTSHTLKLISLTPDTEYFCQVTSEDDLVPANSLTSPEFSFTTLPSAEFQHEPLDEISNVEAILVTDTKAVIEFDTDQGALCLIQSGTSSGSYTNEVAYEDGYDDLLNFNHHHSIHINGLIFETKYYYQISCQDNLSTAIFSVEYDFTTAEKTYTESGWGAQADVTAPEISGVSIGSITGESAIVTWNTDEAANSFVTYSLDGSEISKMVGNYLDPSLADNFVTSHSVTINDLIPSSKYTFSAVSYDAVGNVGQSSLSSFSTKAPSSLSAVNVVSRSLTEARVTWETGSETSSVVEYGLTTAYGEIKENKTETKLHEVIISDLLAGQLYHFRVKGEDAEGNMFASNDNTFQQKTPPQISGFAVNEITERTAKIEFVTNVPTDALVTYTDLIDQKNSGFQGVPTFSTRHAIELKNLTPGANFTLKIRVRDEEGNELEQEFSSFATVSDANPPLIEQIKTDSALTQSDKVQTIISWITDEPAVSALVYKEGMGGEEKEAKVSSEFTTKNSAVFTIFKPGTVYYFKVKSADESFNETTSQEYALLTPRRRENIIQIIVSNFEEIFRWTKR